jgi:hypothetical protein
VPCPDLTRAGARTPDPEKKEEDLRREEEEEEGSVRGEETSQRKIANLLEQLDWYGARLAKRVTPETFAGALLESYPEVNIVAELHHASTWLGDHPSRRKKRLGSFLMNWMKGPPKRPTTPPSSLGRAPTEEQLNQVNWLEGCDNAPEGDS